VYLRPQVPLHDAEDPRSWLGGGPAMAIWRQVADGEMAVMGQVTDGQVEEFDGRTDVALVELRSTNLIGWNFGDVSNLFLSLNRDDLAAGRFDRAVSEIPN
jgi:hypothetical protein